MSNPFDDIIVKMAEKFGLDPDLISAICFVESSFIPTATRYEKDWRYFYEVNFFAEKLGILVGVEKTNQATSWGLMQVMGSVARELGFLEKLEGLKTPELGIFFGCTKLKSLFRRKICDNDEVKVIASYNAGSPRMTKGGMFENQQYVDKVCRKLTELRKLK